MTSTKRKHSFLGWTTSSFANLANSFTNAAQSSSSNAAGAANPPAKITTSASVSTMPNFSSGSSKQSPSSQRRLLSKSSGSRRHSDHERQSNASSNGGRSGDAAAKQPSAASTSKTGVPRYFVLFSDGALLGYKSKVEQSFNDPLNVFTVKDVQTMRVDRPRPFTFLLRGLQHTTIVERMFCTESDRECAAWLEAIRNVSESLKYEAMEQDSISVSQLPVDFGEVESGDEDRISRTTVADAGAQQMEIQFYDAADRPLGSALAVHVEDRRHEARRSRRSHSRTSSSSACSVVELSEKSCSSRRSAPDRLYAIKLLKKEVLINKDEVEHTYTENRLYYHLNGEVRRHNRPFSEERTRLYSAELENLLLDKEGHVKIADFGLCKEDITYQDRCSTFCGTPEYLAPEVIEDGDYSRAVDFCGRLPFFSRDHEKLFELILNGNPRFPTRATAEARALLSGLLGGGVRDALEIMEHPFFSVLDWDKVYRKEYVPQFRPELQGEDDTIYFDQEFTHEPVQLTPPPSRNGHVEGVDDLLNAKFTHFKFQDTYPVSNANGVPPAIPEEQEDEEADDGLQMRSGRP
ncbi:AGC/AKT protein kinase [Aphelenchoides fujianensis]|nr:AGC/AKT protein kinase [Aphelenchoides fujianensis]